MNRFPAWLNALVLALLLAGGLFALPNIYGSVEAVQIADNDGAEFGEGRLAEFVRVVENADITPEAAYLRHLEKCGEILGPRLATIHNLHYYQKLMRDIRVAVDAGTMPQLAAALRAAYEK